MSLQSCDSCGHALAIVDGQCRHCHSSANASAAHARFDPRLLVMLAPLALFLGIFLYRIFLH